MRDEVEEFGVRLWGKYHKINNNNDKHTNLYPLELLRLA